MTIGKRIREERVRLGLNQTDFALLAKTTKQTLYSWEQGKTSPDGFQLEFLAKEGVDVNYILTGQQRAAALSTQEPAANYLDASNDYVYVRRYDVKASAGTGAVIDEENVLDVLAFTKKWITKEMLLDVKYLALINVKGDSMTGTIDDGDLVLLDTRPRDDFRDGIYVINLDGSLLIKRLIRRVTGEVDVVSDNPLFGSETISGKALEKLKIVGRVVWQGRRIP